MRATILIIVVTVLSLLTVAGWQGDSVAEGQTHLTTHHDKVPNFAQNPTIRSRQNGSWFAAATWDAGRLPQADDVVLIAHEVAYDNTTGIADTIGIDNGGALRFATNINTRLNVGNLLVMPGGTLEVGTEANPVAAGVTAEIIIRDKPLDLTNDGVGVYDPEQYGTGLIAANGKVTMHGSPKTPTFVRLAQEPKAGQTTLHLDEPATGWRVGDRLILPDTRQLTWRERDSNADKYSPQWEELTVQGVSSDGKTITIGSPLQFDHLGARDGDGTLRFLPHAGNLSRNAIVRSENPAGTRGHVIFLQRSEVDVRYVLFREVGRSTIDALDNTTFDADGHVIHIGTNQIGRYALHMHHIYGPEVTPENGYQYTLIGNAIDGGSADHKFKWGMAIHDTHYGLIRQNLVYNMAGSGIAFEDGSESFNVLEQNFVVRVFGFGGRADQDLQRFPGAQGTGIWLHGINNYVRNNVVANVSPRIDTFGYVIYNRDASGLIPAFQGADPAKDGQKINMNAIPILQFSGNEAYGALSGGMTVWDVGTWRERVEGAEQSTIKDFRVWHVHRLGFWNYPVSNVVLDGLTIRGDIHNPEGIGLYLVDYLADRLVVRNADIQNMGTGVLAPVRLTAEHPEFVVEQSYLRNGINIVAGYLWSSGTLEALLPRKTIISNVTFASLASLPFRTIVMAWIPDAELPFRNVDLIERNEVYVFNYNQESGADFRVYYLEQHPDYIVPQEDLEQPGLHTGSPEEGLSNQQNWAKYGIAIAGAVASCLDETSQPEITGFVCPITSTGPSDTPDTIPPQAPSNLTVEVQN